MAYYRIADLTVKMETFGRTKEQAEKYRADECVCADAEIVSSWPRIRADYPYLDDDLGEYLFTGVNFYKHLLNFSGFMLHSSCVVVDEKAYLFSADSGTGKSTHVNMWLERFGARAFILNDDKPALRLVNGKWYAYGTPWSGKNDISRNFRVQVQGIAMIERAQENAIERFMGINAIAAVIRQCNRPRDKESREKLLALLEKLFEMVPVWRLKCNTERDSVDVSYRAMSEK